MTVIDLGANVGYFTLIMADLVGPRGLVYACEPLPRNLDLLKRSIAENKLQRRVHVLPVAAGAPQGSGRLLTPSCTTNWGGAYLLSQKGTKKPQHEMLHVTVVRLDSLRIARRVGFIKADIEGAEYLAMKGSRRLLERDQPVVMCECNPSQLSAVSNVTPTQFVDFMAHLGYSVRRLEGTQLADVDCMHLQQGITTLVFVPSATCKEKGND